MVYSIPGLALGGFIWPLFVPVLAWLGEGLLGDHHPRRWPTAPPTFCPFCRGGSRGRNEWLPCIGPTLAKVTGHWLRPRR